jgi:hypothetical protein
MYQLSLRTNPENPNHHLWNNNGTWFIHYVVHPTPITKERIRKSLGTKSLAEARSKRDAILSGQSVPRFSFPETLDTSENRVLHAQEDVAA